MKNKPLRLFFACIFLTSTHLFAQLSIKTDRLSGRYAVGDTAYFVVQSNSDSLVSYAFKYGIGVDLPPLRSGQFRITGGYAFIAYVATEPGFVHCSVTQDSQSLYVGATFDPFEIKPPEPEIVGFDAFWAAQKAALAAIPLRVSVQNRDTTAFAIKYSFNIDLVDGKKVYGYLSVPRGNGLYPAIIRLPAFGSVPNVVSDEPELSERGGVISVFVNIHNNLPTQNGPSDYLNINLDNPNNYYLKYALLGVVKTIDYLQTRSDFNGKVGVIGISQGGGLAILAAGIDPRISLLVSSYPAFCAHPNLKYNKPSGFPSYLRLSQLVGLQADTVLKTVKFYDAVTAAKRFKGVSWTMVSYVDDVCNAATVYEAFNQLKGQKIITHVQNRGHVFGPDEYVKPDFQNGIYSFFRRHFPEYNNAPSAWLNTTLGYLMDAGKDTVLSQNNGLILRGSFFLENAVCNLPIRWRKVEGPGLVTFSNPNSLTTNVGFSTVGTYRLRLMAEDFSTLTSDAKYTTISDDIVITVGTVIPVELMAFSGKTTAFGNELMWQTASEKAHKSFELERSADGKNWVLLAKIKGNGNQNTLNRYQFTDEGPLSISYYRLKQLDENGDFSYSKIISLRQSEKEKFDVFPNPVCDVLTININGLDGAFDLKIYDVLGRVYLSKTLKPNDLSHNVSDLVNGEYFVEIKHKTGVWVKKMVKISRE